MAFGDVVQDEVGSLFNTTSITTTYTQVTTAGNLIICVTSPDKNSGLITIPSGFLQASQIQNASVSGALSYKIADGTETNIISSWVNTVHGSQSIWEIEGPFNSSPLDVDTNNSSNDIAVRSLSTGTTATTTQAEEYVFGVYLQDSSSNLVNTVPFATNSFTNRLLFSTGGGAAGQIIADKVTSSTSTQETTISYTGGGTDQAIAFIAAFKKDSGGGGISITSLLNLNYMVEYSMKQNVAGQSIGAQMVTISDGSPFTGTVSADVTIDNGTKTAGSGTVTHEGDGYHSYAPTQAETNGNHIAVTFSGTGALSQTIQVYTTFPQTVDNDTAIQALNDISPAQVNAECDTALSDYDGPTNTEMNARTIISASYALEASIGSLNDFNPASDAVANVTLVATTTTNTDMRGTDSALLASGYTVAPTTAQIWAESTRVLTAGDNIVLAKGVGLTGLNDIAATAIVTGGAITTSGGVANVDIKKVNAVTIIGAGTAGDLWRA